MRSQQQNHRSNNKLMQYLQAENRQLKDEISDLREMVQFNKVQIDVLSKNNPSNKYIEVISNYRIAAENYQKKIELVDQKLQTVISQKLVLQQLHQQSTQQLRALSQLHKDRTQSLQSLIDDLQKKIVILEKTQRSYDTLTGFVERNRDIYNPTEQAMEFKGKEEQMEDQMHLLKMEIQRGKENQDNLLKINGILRHKVVTLQAKLAMPNKNLGQILDKSLKRLMMYFIQTQKRILTGQQSDSEGEEDLQLIAPQLSTYFGQQSIRKQKNYNVPHIDLLKIRGSIANGNQKIKQELLKRNHLSQGQKIQRLEIELEYTRRELTRHIIDIREEKDRRKMLERICEELQARNSILTQAYGRAEQKLNKYLTKVKQSKQKQLKFIDIDQTINDMSMLPKQDNNLIDQHNTRRPVDPPVSRPVQKGLQIYQSPQQYKIHLQLLAKDLSKNQKILNLPNLKRKQQIQTQQWQPRLKRSTSNPFLYFNERRQDIMQVCQDGNNDKKKDKIRLEQTAIFGNGLHLEQDLDDIMLD